MALDIRIDRHLIGAAGGSVRYLLASVTAPQAPPTTAREHEQFMSAVEMKKRHYASYSVMRNRAPDERARR